MNSRVFTAAAAAAASLGLVSILALGAWGAEPEQSSGMAFIPGGEFLRGRTFTWTDAEVAWYPRAAQDDLPVKDVKLDPFYLDIAEVTNEKYARFVKATGHRTPYHWKKHRMPEGKESLPVVNVSWEDAAAYCHWEAKRLPTEAEWERAAKGHVAKGMYPWGDRAITAQDAVYGAQGPAQVCSKQRNAFGLCDMTGNVWEWCADWYGRTYYESSPLTNPQGPEKGMYRVLRGGSWFDQPTLFLTVSYRSWARPAERSATIGFRCAKSFGARSR